MTPKEVKICPIEWETVVSYCKDIATQITEKKLKFDVLVPVIRGGLVPATILSNLLGNIPIKPITWQTRDGNKKGKKELVRIMRKNSKILIVDDLIDSGLTMFEIDAYIKMYNQFNLNNSRFTEPVIEHWSAVMLYNGKCNYPISGDFLDKLIFSQGYLNSDVFGWKWWDFPWEVKLDELED